MRVLLVAASLWLLTLVVVGSVRAQEARSATQTPKQAIRAVFGKYADQAIRVVSCETGGTFSTTARNGQYLGLFQMGSWERRTYAHGRYTTPLDQSRAAWRYFAATGFDWSPWTCKP